MKPGDIVLIRFPQTDLQAGKLRPALVVASAPGRHADLLLALISSQIHQGITDFDEFIAKDATDFPQTGLKAPSIVRLARLASVNSTVINARLGAIDAARLQRIVKRIAQWIYKEYPLKEPDNRAEVAGTSVSPVEEQDSEHQ